MSARFQTGRAIPSLVPAVPAVEVRNVHKAFGPHQALAGVDLTVADGSIIAIIGPSGSGKSTLLRTVNHLEKPDKGYVRVYGELMGVTVRRGQLRELPESTVLRQRAGIGFVFQSFNLFPHLTVLDNVVEAPVAAQGRPREQVRDLASQLLARVGLADRAGAFPRQLSGGQQQRVAIARALALEPRLILLDEPTSALDPELVGEVLGALRDLAQAGSTLIVVTHEIAFAREVADQVVFMDQGRILEQGPPDMLLDHPRHDRTREFLRQVL